MTPRPLPTADIAAAADAFMAAAYSQPRAQRWNIAAVGNWLMGRLAERQAEEVPAR